MIERIAIVFAFLLMCIHIVRLDEPHAIAAHDLWRKLRIGRSVETRGVSSLPH